MFVTFVGAGAPNTLTSAKVTLEELDREMTGMDALTRAIGRGCHERDESDGRILVVDIDRPLPCRVRDDERNEVDEETAPGSPRVGLSAVLPCQGGETINRGGSG